MEELKQAFYEVMYKYEKSFGETGVMANLNEWAKNKAFLLDLLRHHPGWDEDAKAIVFTFDEGRGIEHDVVDEIAFTMEDLAADQIKDEQRLEDFRISLRTAVSEYSSTLSEQALEVTYPGRHQMRHRAENQPDHRQAVQAVRCGRARTL